MADEKRSSTLTDLLQSRAGLAAIIIALTSLLLIKPSPLNSERPSIAPGGSRSYGAPQDVDARLWQDPFQAVNDATKNTGAKRLEIKTPDGKNVTIELSDSKKQNSHPSEHIYSELPSQTKGEQITLMAVMMSASPTPEDHESRLRQRYALVSALANREYAPVDSDHIGYFRTDNSKNQGLPEIIPFEWFESTDENLPKKVLVLWIDDTRFDRDPVEKTRQLFDQLAGAAKGKVGDPGKFHRIVMGPSSSGNLRAMALEVKDWRKKNVQTMSDVWFYSSQATMADREILKGIADGKFLSEFLNDKGIHLVRTIADDHSVIASLVEELSIRHVRSDDAKRNGANDVDNDKLNHVVLLSDWDTSYGRALPLYFEKAYEPQKTPKCSSLNNTDDHVHCFKYVRGIDGALPGAPNNDKEQSGQAKPESGSASKPVDRPEGMSQKDYLRRIVEEIRKLDQLLRKDRPCVTRCGVVAIGVLGYDVYDKLMILRALRPYFPNKTFFTTDLSASYWSPEEMPYTHNLIVSSGFGLALNPQLQKDIPPFRDSYQTSFFLSALLALNNETGKIPGVDEPRIFEIGRNGPIDLGNPLNNPADYTSTATENRRAVSEKNCDHDISACHTVHPANIFEQSREDHKTLVKYILAACGLVLLYLASWNVRRWVNHLFRKNENDVLPTAPVRFIHKFSWKRIGVVLCFLLFAIAIWAMANDPTVNKEPWLWLEGVSIWPSELLRFVALIASLLLLLDVFQKITKNDEEIAAAFGLREKGWKEQAGPGLITTLWHAVSSLNNCSSVLKWQSAKKGRTWLSKTTLNGLEGQVINVSRLWESYRRMGERKRRVCRALIGIVPFLIFAWSSIILSGGMSTPARGDFAYYTDKILIGTTGLLMLFLAMLVIDASRLCAAFISHLDETQSDWLTGSRNPSCSMIHLSNQWGLKPAYTAYWLDTQFVAQRTEVIQRLIWYPVIPVFLLAIARSPVFDDWPHPMGLIATLGILIVYLISCAFLLEYGAKKMRDKASKQLGAELRKLRGSFGSGNNPKIGRLENLIKEIEGLKQGAFLPLFQQPWVEAVLAMSSGAGGLAWMGNLLGTP
jgi:hypothetical protein